MRHLTLAYACSCCASCRRYCGGSRCDASAASSAHARSLRRCSSEPGAAICERAGQAAARHAGMRARVSKVCRAVRCQLCAVAPERTRAATPTPHGTTRRTHAVVGRLVPPPSVLQVPGRPAQAAAPLLLAGLAALKQAHQQLWQHDDGARSCTTAAAAAAAAAGVVWGVTVHVHGTTPAPAEPIFLNQRHHTVPRGPHLRPQGAV
jgi:hypothetical protein